MKTGVLLLAGIIIFGVASVIESKTIAEQEFYHQQIMNMNQAVYEHCYLQTGKMNPTEKEIYEYYIQHRYECDCVEADDLYWHDM